ncbi:MarR family winged helix-turn-helix transcriptional regulator [Sphingomonas sp.]|uniref:MarR family winged helix-turn-helix transcriptional regulator n=1 Tax=Sphingomonas sp. TaxID=28214 RepID=UPI000DB5BFBB|nr:MarR family winged helix-turn-helix transcriptional regulator [Sphingomonas sp.]PZU10773.1 MAG: MarR family transcriptional regulator [Sphingomonas sp.]
MAGKKNTDDGFYDLEEERFKIDEWPIYWLTRVVSLYLTQSEGQLKRIGLDIPSWRVLMFLGKDQSASVSELADHAIAKLSTMTKIIQRMQAEGLVECSPRENDGRVTEVRLTERGFEARADAWAVSHRTYERAFGQVPAKETKALITTLSRVFDALKR